MSSNSYVVFLPSQAARPSRILILCRPLLLFPLICVVVTRRSNFLFLVTLPIILPASGVVSQAKSILIEVFFTLAEDTRTGAHRVVVLVKEQCRLDGYIRKH